MYKLVNVKKHKRFCDVKNCKEAATKLNENKELDYCHKHALKQHKCNFITKYRFDEDDHYGLIRVIKKIGCIEENTICPDRSNYLLATPDSEIDKFKKELYMTYNFKKNEFPELVFKLFEKLNLPIAGWKNYGEEAFKFEEKHMNNLKQLLVEAEEKNEN